MISIIWFSIVVSIILIFIDLIYSLKRFPGLLPLRPGSGQTDKIRKIKKKLENQKDLKKWKTIISIIWSLLIFPDYHLAGGLVHYHHVSSRRPGGNKISWKIMSFHAKMMIFHWKNMIFHGQILVFHEILLPPGRWPTKFQTNHYFSRKNGDFP